MKKSTIHTYCVSILQCTTSYPSSSGDWGLKLIPDLRDRYNVPIGFSDHSGQIHACLAATVLGAKILEFHTVFDKSMFGPDAKSSLTIDQVKKLVFGVQEINNDLQNYRNLKEDNSKFFELKSIFEKSLAVNKNMSKGDIISFDDLEAKKPANMGINAVLFEDLIGKKLTVDLKKWDFLKWDFLK